MVVESHFTWYLRLTTGDGESKKDTAIIRVVGRWEVLGEDAAKGKCSVRTASTRSTLGRPQPRVR